MKTFNRFAFIPLMATALVILPLSGAWSANGGVKVGVLSCDSVPGTRVNMVIHSSVQIVCSFVTPQGVERYRGETGIGIGIDLNWNRQEKITFAVLMAATDIRIGSHALSGTYVGGKASATLGLGVGAAVLIGGGDNNVSLQPLAVEVSSGLGVAGGLGYLTLWPEKRIEQVQQVE